MIGSLNTRLAGRCRKGGPLIVNMLGKTIVFVASLSHTVSYSLRLSFVSISDCKTKVRSDNSIGVLGSLSAAISKHSLLVIRSVVSAKQALDCLVRVFGCHGTGSVGMIALVSGGRHHMISLRTSCVNVGIPGRFIIKCKLSFGRGCHGLPCVNVLGARICRWGRSLGLIECSVVGKVLMC